MGEEIELEERRNVEEVSHPYSERFVCALSN
jgi:hypothetical protein